MAIQVATDYQAEGVTELFQNLATGLIKKGKYVEAAQLYRKANFCKESSEILYQVTLYKNVPI